MFRYCIATSRRLARRHVVLIVLILIIFIITTNIGNRSIKQFTKNSPLLGIPLKNLMNAVQALNTTLATNSCSVSDDFPWTYLINEPHFCQDRTNIFIINIVATIPNNVKRRNLIRKMWGNGNYLKKTGFATVFLIASSNERNMFDKVKDESLVHRDILLMDFQESYHNLTLKTLTILHWTSKYCTSPRWVLKSDIDVFINPFSLSKHLMHIDIPKGKVTEKFVCSGTGPKSVCREECRMKWRVTLEEYPNEKYPRYCLGPAYTIPRKLVCPLYKQANKTHPFRMEDVYYTGILPIEMGMGEIINNLDKNIFPMAPKKWSKALITRSLMIMGLERKFGINGTIFLWNHVLKNVGIIRKIEKEIDNLFTIKKW